MGSNTPEIHRVILRWYRRNGRTLPWRRTRNHYRILISEVMLQQTQVSRVLQKYPEFLRQFPNFRSLARATPSNLIKAWRGMGYNNRVVRLRRLAVSIIEERNGRLPRSSEALQELPGVGKYTAQALSCFAFRNHVPVVDTNIRRALSRLFPYLSRKLDEWKLAESVLPRNLAYDWNQALMDLGSMICTSAKPHCAECPAAGLCPSAFRVPKSSARQSKPEPGRDGVPNRIYRGRIVEVLRNLNGRRSIAGSALGAQIKRRFVRSDRRWLMSLITSLQQDGLVSLSRRKNKMFVSLPR